MENNPARQAAPEVVLESEATQRSQVQNLLIKHYSNLITLSIKVAGGFLEEEKKPI